MTADRPVEARIRPPWPYRLPARGGADGVLRVRRGVASRLLHVDVHAVIVRAWQRRDGEVVLRATGEGDRETLERALERMRFALGVDDDLRPFYRRFRSDRLLGPAIRRRPWHRPSRRPWPWEALAWAVTKQLIESARAAAIQRRIVWRWGPRLADQAVVPATSPRGRRAPVLRDVPGPEEIAARAPAELAALDLAPSRALSLIRVAREVARGRVDPARPAADRRLLAIPGIGPWTVQCLGLYGRGDADALPAGDLGFLKLVGRLARLGRRATIPEVEELFAPYVPFRGLAGSFVLRHYAKAIPSGAPLRVAA